MSEHPISGALAAAVTPLRDAGARVDEDALPGLLAFYDSSGLDGVFVLGTTGEGIMLGGDERRRVAELAVAGARSLKVVVHCGAQTTAQTSELSAHAAEAGADAVAVIAPPFFQFGADELLEHFAAAAGACAPLPFYVYEYADRSGYAIPVSVVQRLRDRVSNLAGMKVSDAPFERVEPYLATGLDLFIGAEGLLLEGLAKGAAGAVSGLAAAFPEAVSALVADPTRERAERVDALRGALSGRPLPAAVKAVLGLRGQSVRLDVRAPMRPLESSAVEQLCNEIERLVGPFVAA